MLTKAGGKMGSIVGNGVDVREPPKDSNPWSSAPQNIDPKAGRYNASAMSRQSRLAAANPKMAAGLAAHCGVFLGATSPTSKRLVQAVETKFGAR
jgi:hypothetical protein